MSVRYLGINYLGYGIIPRVVMQDKKISIIGKALYAYVCAFSGGGVSVIPNVDEICKHLCIDNKTFHEAIIELSHNKYLSYIQQDENTVNITLHNNIQVNSNREYITKNDYITVKDMVKKQICYELYVEDNVNNEVNIDIIDEVLLCICEMWYSDSTFANGTNYRQDVVRERIEKIDIVIMSDIIQQITDQKKGKKDQNGVRVIKNPRNYIKAMIFNAVGKALNDNVPNYS